MENRLRADLIAWLRNDPALEDINAIEEESPLRASVPWLGVSASASTDWGVKEKPGREIRIALELETRIDDPAQDADILSSIEQRVLDLPPFAQGYEVASIRFLRSRSEQRDNNRRGALLEFRFRLFHV
ncbi:MAG: DUF3168 domain-containing protein [Erythrobacter sp.]|uniref:tail completion protein gp17 n=1 Tax=Erythrobacter sp. TaxID=1042 RepID=UPI0026391434|nr:DUF3168 domain-containing protein [Erythrobacter sp.]MDJ0979498.1 DUF3168 domain-containing protein [Erythrobacter sp.]